MRKLVFGEQLELELAHTRARRTDPNTSHAAAGSLSRASTARLRRVILKALRLFGPMSDQDLVRRIQGVTEYSPSGIRTRRSELVATGQVMWTGVTVPGDTGRQVHIWRLTQPEEDA